MLNDLRYGFRSLLKSPVYTLVAVATLGLAIAADCVVFSVADAVLFRPLPYKDPDRLANVFSGTKGHGATWAPELKEFLEWKRRNNVFEDLALTDSSVVTLKIGDYPEPATALTATANLFDVLGVKPAMGRTFLPEEAYAGRAEQVVVLGYDFWKNRFHGDPAILGKQIGVGDGPKRTIVGVLPSGVKFTYPNGYAVWLPMAIDRAPSRVLFELGARLVTARLRPGVTPAQAEAGLRAVLDDLARESPLPLPKSYQPDARVISVRGWTTRQVRSILFTLLGAVTFVLLIGCANVANLSLARMADRERETTMRAALGASRWRLVREFLTESLLVALAAGAFGLLLSSWGMAAVRSVLPPELPRGDELRLDGNVALFALAASLATTVAFGLLPALRCSKINLLEGLSGSSTGLGGRRNRGVRASLIVVETALALVLTGGAGLMMNSFIRLMRVDLGFNPTNVLAVQVETAGDRAFRAMMDKPATTKAQIEERMGLWSQASREARQTNERMLDSIRSLPGVQQAGLVFPAPLLGGESGAMIMGPEATSPIKVRYKDVAGDYFAAMQIPVVGGRGCADEDADQPERRMVLNQSLARLLFPNGGAVGRRIPGRWQIMGVVADARNQLLFAPEPEAFACAQYAGFGPGRLGQGRYVVRHTEAAKASLNGLIRQKANEIDPEARVAIDSFETAVAQQGAQTRFLALLFAGAGGLGLLLSASGVFAVTAYGVNRRTREIGVRMALGATPKDVLRTTVREGIAMAAAGTVIGTAATLAMGNVLRTVLFEVRPADPLTMGAVVLVLAVTTLAASYIPARRALSLDPAVALRHE
jgi:putative ABC transport system permease protein